MDPFENAKTNRQISPSPEAAQAENERRLFHLKTLYDVSRELLGIVEVKTILKNFLLMTLGNFGVVEGILFTQDPHSLEASQLVTIGLEADDNEFTRQGALDFLVNDNPGSAILADEERRRLKFLPQAVDCVMCFSVDEDYTGLWDSVPRLLVIPIAMKTGIFLKLW
jgi:hypothetical protein